MIMAAYENIVAAWHPHEHLALGLHLAVAIATEACGYVTRGESAAGTNLLFCASDSHCDAARLARIPRISTTGWSSHSMTATGWPAASKTTVNPTVGVSVVSWKYTRDWGPVTVEFSIFGLKDVKVKDNIVGAGTGVENGSAPNIDGWGGKLPKGAGAFLAGAFHPPCA